MLHQRVASFILCACFFMTLLFCPRASRARDELKNEDPEKYYILLDLVNQIVTVFEKDAFGEYSVIVRQFLCTTGRTQIDPEIEGDMGTPTPRGVWKIGGRERFGKFANFGSEYARYWTQIVGSVFFHSVMFGSRSVNSMKSNPYYKLGSNVSHGCVRLYVEDAKWLYYYACPGTTIRVSTSEKKDGARKKQLKSELSFQRYNALQKNFFDEPELPNLEATVTVKGAHLRKGSGDGFARILTLPVGASVEVLMEGEAWTKVKYNKREGYVRRGYLSFIPNAMDTRPDATLLSETSWLFAEPDDDSEPLVKIPADVSVRVLNTRDDGWTELSYWNETGFVQSRRLKSGWGVDMG